MASQDGQNNPPDSWDQELNGGSGDTVQSDELSKPLTNLNVNAPAFVPGQNIFAAEFVPIPQADTEDEQTETPPAEDDSSKQTSEVIEEKTENNVNENHESPEGGEDGEVGDWEEEEEDEGSGDADTPDSEDTPSDIAATVAKKKKAAAKKSENVKKEHVNVVFIGHVDAGKSTIGGHIMYLTGQVDKRTLDKYEREAKEKNRETWYLSWALDTNQEERDKGKTVEVGRAFFETDLRHFTILDAPGHKSFVPNMIGGASQADLAVLVISARKGEFETGFERGGQTREHAMLAKTAGVKHLIVLINKMDDPTVEWAEERYNECRDKLIPYLKKVGFNPKVDVYFMPVSGMTGAFLKEAPSEEVCPWYRGPPLIEYLDNLPSMNRMAEGPVRLPVVDRYKDMGTIVLGKVESGVIKKAQTLMMMPNKVTVEVMMLWSDDEDTDVANPGENVKVKLKGVEEEDVSPGFVLCSLDSLCHTGHIFDAQIVILEHKSIICAGYSAILHIHTCAEEITIKGLLCLLDKKTGEKTVMKPRFIKQDQVAIARLEVNGGMICLEAFKQFPQMGRFTLRDEGRTIAIGKVLKVRD